MMCRGPNSGSSPFQCFIASEISARKSADIQSHKQQSCPRTPSANPWPNYLREKLRVKVHLDSTVAISSSVSHLDQSSQCLYVCHVPPPHGWVMVLVAACSPPPLFSPNKAHFPTGKFESAPFPIHCLLFSLIVWATRSQAWPKNACNTTVA